MRWVPRFVYLYSGLNLEYSRLNLEQYSTTAKNISRNKIDFPNLFVYILFQSTIIINIVYNFISHLVQRLKHFLIALEQDPISKY